MDIEAAVHRVQTLVGALSGIREAPTEPPGQMAVWPFSVCWFGTGTFSLADASYMVVENGILILEVHWSRKDITRDLQKAMDYIESIPKEILTDPTLDSHLDGVWQMTARLGLMEWATQPTLGWHYEISFGAHEGTS